MTGPAVAVEDVTRFFEPRRKRDARVVALDHVSLEIPLGEIHGLLGPNGAGKTTLVKILSTVLVPTSGRASVLGHDVVADARAVRPVIGIVFGGERGLYWRLTGRQNLEYWGALYKLTRAELKHRSEELITRVGLSERADERLETYSRGMKQRLHLARGLIGNAKVLFLDDPTTWMDPLAAREFRALIAELRGEGRTILLATHNMAEAERLCDRVTLIDGGAVVATEPPAALAARLRYDYRIEADDAPEFVAAALAGIPDVRVLVAPEPGRLRVEAGAAAAPGVTRRLLEAGVTSLRVRPPALE